MVILGVCSFASASQYFLAFPSLPSPGERSAHSPSAAVVFGTVPGERIDAKAGRIEVPLTIPYLEPLA